MRGGPAGQLVEENAAYCPQDESVYFDEDWLRGYRAGLATLTRRNPCP